MFRAGVVLCVLLGAEVAAIAVGALGLGDGRGVALFVIGLNLAPWTGVFGFGLMYGSRRRRVDRARTGRLRPALARIESVRAVGEGPEFPLRLDLTVAPEAGDPYRAVTRSTANVMALDEYRVGRTLDVEYDAEDPGYVRVVRPSGMAWPARVALAKTTGLAVLPRRTAGDGRTGAGRTGLLAAAAGLLLAVVPLWSYGHPFS